MGTGSFLAICVLMKMTNIMAYYCSLDRNCQTPTCQCRSDKWNLIQSFQFPESFAELLGDDLQHLTDEFLNQLLENCPDIRCSYQNGERLYNYCSTATSHIMKMNAVSKPPRRGRSRQSRRAKPKPAAPATSQPKRVERAERAVFFENNRIYLNRKYRVSGGSHQETANRSRSSGNVSFEVS
jgi:hypothetical protein